MTRSCGARGPTGSLPRRRSSGRAAGGERGPDRSEAIAGDAPVQRAPRQPERLRGPTHVSVVPRQGFLNEQLLDVLERQLVETWRRARRHPKSQIASPDVIALREQHGALDRMIELANVTGPGVAEQQLHGAGVEAAERFAIARRVSAEEVRRERGNVLTPVAQCRKADLDRVQPKEQILSKAALG